MPPLTWSPGHVLDFIRACKGGDPGCSNFDVAAPFVERMLLGVIALRYEERLEYDPDKVRITGLGLARTSRKLQASIPVVFCTRRLETIRLANEEYFRAGSSPLPGLAANLDQFGQRLDTLNCLGCDLGAVRRTADQAVRVERDTQHEVFGGSQADLPIVLHLQEDPKRLGSHI